jgi:hypothetical protein
MYQKGKRDLEDQLPLPALYEPVDTRRAVFPGKPHLQQNLAVQRSIMGIFDEFTEIISGELKSLDLEAFKQERKSSSR